MFDQAELAGMIADVFRIHDQFARKPEKRFRKFDRKTPFGVHPVTLGLLFLQEESLDEDLRMLGAKVLFAHDMPEDTTGDLPAWASTSEVKSLVLELTVASGQDKFMSIWTKSHTAKLFALFDFTYNLTCASQASAEKMARHAAQTQRLADYIRVGYPHLEILKMAEGLLKPYMPEIH